MRGRKPKSNQAHKEEGTLRKDRHKPPSAPRDILKALPFPPESMSEEGAEKWKLAGGQLVAAGILTELDLDALQNYCEAWSLYREAMRTIEKDGITYEGINGPRKHPAVQIAETSWKTMLALQERLGLTPLARQRLRIEDGSEEKDKLAAFMEQAQS